MTHLRKMMLEELQRRNYAETTIDCYLRAVEDFSRHFHSSPDRLGPRHIREYQAALFHQRKFSPNTVAQHLAALRFFYTKTLKRTWSITETPYPKKAFHLPTILSQDLAPIKAPESKPYSLVVKYSQSLPRMCCTGRTPEPSLSTFQEWQGQ